MPVNLVSGADIKAISIVGKGANRKRFFLTKAEGDAAEPLPSVERLLKAADWSAVYCVVAEPDWHESPGMGADQSVEDRWASEDEIRKAAHRFMANGGLVTKMHESLEPYGQLVENAVALDDFTVDGEVIRKGSWYIAIEPSDEGKAAIEKGGFTGVSIEGLAVRELVEKRAFSTDNDTTEVRPMSIASANPFEGLAEAIVKGLGLPTASEAAEDAEDRLAQKVAERMAQQAAPTREELWCELEGVNPALAGVFGPTAEEALIAKALAAPSIEGQRKECERLGVDPSLAGIFGGA
ncbi:MAG TPA: XkdF-like putative serine protease domain-containing protein [Solirubrobacterales bacterium]|jgi:hypothetical protein|nr:XkdF-like putative serine protease domain-containing protein [Solirubrobacterales bacterium]